MEDPWTPLDPDDCRKWIAKFSYKGPEKEDPDHHLSLLPGDRVVPTQETKDWFYGYKMDEKRRMGIFPKNFVSNVRALDCVLDKTKDILIHCYKSRKNTWLNIDGFETSPAARNESEDLFQKCYLLSDIRRIRIRCYPKMSKYILEKQQEELIDCIKSFPMVDEDKLLPDKDCNLMSPNTTTLTKIYDMQASVEKEFKTRSLGSRLSGLGSDENVTLSFSFKEVKIQDGIEKGQVDFVTALYGSNGFLTEFFVYPDITNNKPTQHFIIQDLARSSQAALVCLVVVTDSMGAKKCRGVAVIKAEDIMQTLEHEEEGCFKEIKMAYVVHKEGTVIEQIRKTLSEVQTGSNHMLFRCKKIKKENIKEDDFVYKRCVNLTLNDTGINNLFVFVDHAKITGGLGLIMGDSWNVSIEVEVCDESGNVLQSVSSSSSNSRTSSYQTLSCPTIAKLEWKENLCIGIQTRDQMWKKLHLRFSIHRQDEKKRKLYGFAYLPLKNDNDTIIVDQSYNLMVFQLEKNLSEVPNPEDYLDKTYILDPNMRTKAVKDLYEKKKFSVSTKDVLAVQTKLHSTAITEDPTIQGIISLDPDIATSETIKDVLDKFLSPAKTVEVNRKKILFLKPILNALWNILEKVPDEARKVFDCFVETIHPIITNSKDFGYAESLLLSYIQLEFKSPHVYEAFSNVMTEAMNLVIGQEELSPDENTKFVYQMKCLKIIFLFVVNSFKVKPDNSLEPFRNLILQFGEFIKSNTKLTQVKGYCLKSIFDEGTINACLEVIDKETVADMAADVLDTIGITERNTMASITKLFMSKLFVEPGVRDKIFEIGMKEITRKVTQSASSSKFVVHKGLEIPIVDLAICIFDQVNSIEDEEKKELFIRKMVCIILPRIIDIFSMPATSFRGSIVGRRDNSASKKELLLITFLGEIDDDSFNELVSDKKYPFLERIFNILQNPKEFTIFKKQSFKVRLFILEAISNFLLRVARTDMLPKEKTSTVQHFVVAASHVVTSEELQKKTNMRPSRLSAEIRQSFKNSTGNMCLDVTSYIVKVISELPNKKILNMINPETAVYGDRHCNTLENIFTASQSRIPAIREQMISLMFKLAKAEYFAKVGPKENLNGHIEYFYSTFLKRTMASYKNKVMMVDLKYRQEFFEVLKKLMADLYNPEDADISGFIQKMKVGLKHLHELGDCVRDVLGVVETFDDSSDNPFTDHHFAYITAEYNLFLKLRSIETESWEENIIKPDLTDVSWIRQECINLLAKLFDIHTHEGGSSKARVPTEFICAGFTMQELDNLIPWSDEEPERHLQVLFSRLAPDTKTEVVKNQKTTWTHLKETIQKIAIDKFLKATGFECSLNMKEDAIERYKTEVFDYKELSIAYKSLSDIYERISDFHGKLEKIMKTEKNAGEERSKMENDRRDILDPEYYRVSFHSMPKNLQFLEDKTYIFRAKAFEVMRDFQAKIKEWFPTATLVMGIENNNQERKRKSSFMGDPMVIQINKVDPVMSRVDEYEGKAVPPEVLKYVLKNRTNTFIFKKAYEPYGKNKENPNATTWMKNWVFTTEFNLPGMLRWSETTGDPKIIETRPIVNTLTILQDTNTDLQMMKAELKKNPKAIACQLLGQKLSGIINADVQGGIQKIEEAFLTEEYMKSEPEDATYIRNLKSELVKQMSILQPLLEIHDTYKIEQMQPFHDVMVKNLEMKKESVRTKYGTKIDNPGFQVTALVKEVLRERPASVQMNTLKP